MYRAILPDGEITCTTYSRTDDGVELYTESDELLAFVPYSNLVAIINDDAYNTHERSVM